MGSGAVLTTHQVGSTKPGAGSTELGAGSTELGAVTSTKLGWIRPAILDACEAGQMRGGPNGTHQVRERWKDGQMHFPL